MRRPSPSFRRFLATANDAVTAARLADDATRAAPAPCDRIAVLLSQGERRVYPVPAGQPLRDEYWIQGRCWTVCDVYRPADAAEPRGALS